MSRAVVLVLLMAGVTAAFAQTPEEDVPFVESEPRLDFGVVADLRLAVTDVTASFMDRGLGKNRYGGDENGERRALFRLPQLSFIAEARLFENLSAHLHVNFDAEPERGDFEERVDLVEAFLRYGFGEGSPNEVRGKLGLFFPPISLEHPGAAWTTFYTITPSILNGWVGEEVRALGGEISYARVGLENEFSITGAGFGWNDPSASLLAYRGWAATDRQTGLADQIPLAPLPSISEGGIFQDQARWAEPIEEVDDRAGYYAGIAWDNYRRLLVNALYYDNRARPDAFDSEQYGWRTRFVNVGALWTPGEGTAGPEVLFQYLSGDTWMGNQVPGLPKVTFDFRAAYGLLSIPFGRQRLSFRYDWFETVDLDDFRAVDNNDEDGFALTFAYLVRTTEKQRLGFEFLRMESSRLARAFLGLPVDATEWLFQMSYRVEF